MWSSALIYRQRGIPEYCENYGLKFNNENFLEKLNEVVENYRLYEEKIKEYPFNATNMSKDYLELFEEMISNKEIILRNRNIPKKTIFSRVLFILRSFIKKIR